MAKSKIAKTLDDSGWFSVYSDYCSVLRRNGWCQIIGSSWGTMTLANDTSNWHDLTTLPEEFRPSSTTYFLGASINGDTTIRFRVQPSGIVSYICAYPNISYWMYTGTYAK